MKLKYFYVVLSIFLMLIVRQELHAQFEQTTITEYENQYFQVRKTRSQNSDGSWTSTSYKYVFDDSQYSAMVGLNMVSKVIEETVSLEWYNANVLDNSKTKKLFTTTTTYSNNNGANLYLPLKIEKKIGNGTNQLLIEFLEYDTFGNLKKYKAKDGLSNTFNYFTGNGKANLVSSHINNANQTTSYDYVPLVGVSTVTDINLKTSTYNYDNFNRLKKVSDHVGPLKEYSYHYAGQTVENPISSAYSVTPPACLSCGTDKYLNLDKSTWIPNASAASTSVAVTSNDGTWSVSSDASSWLSVTNIAGATGNGSFIINTLTNTGTTTREGKITVQSNSGIKSSIAVVQASNSSTLSVSPDTWAPTASANNTIINVTSNVSWTATSQNSWLSVNDNTSINGTNNGTFTLKAIANDGTNIRTGKIVLTGGGLTREINVTQSGSSSTLSISSTSWSTIANAGSTSISVSSNSNWTVSSNSGWLTISPASGNGNGSFTITATQNTGTSSRDGIITVTVGGISQTITVTQGTTSSSTCPEEVLVGKQGDADVVIKHFDSYYLLCTKSMSGSIARYVPRGKNYWNWSGFVKNSNVDQYYACINVNDSNYSGLASPFASNYVPTGWLSSTFLDSDNNPILYYYQNASSPTLSLSQSSWSPSASSNTLNVSVSSNVSWTAASSAGWLSVSPSSGSNNGTLTLTATANTGSARTGTITVAGGGLTQTLSVSQGASGSTGSCIVNKVRLLFRADCCYDRLVGAKLQGSTNNSTWTDIYTFSVNGTGSWQEFTFSNSTAYQYVRFQASANGYGELFELEFYNGSTKLTGTVIGAGQALDGDVGTFWHGGAIGTVNYAGLQLSNTCTVTPPTLSLSQSSWAPSASSNSTTVSVISNVSWTATSSATGWLTVSPASGSNNGTLTSTATANTGSARTGTITVTGGGLTQTVSVTQSGGSSGSNVVSNGNCYTIQSKQTNNYMQLMSDGTIQQQAANNQTTQIWKAISSGSSYQFVSQSNQQYLKVDNYNEGSQVTSGTSGNNVWNLEAYNGAYRVSTPTGITWDMQGYGTGQYLQLYGNTSESFGNHRLWNFNQATCNNPSTLTLSQSSWSPSASSNTLNVSVSSNVSWTAASSAGWLSVSPSSGSNNGTLTLTATANTGSARTGTITVAGGGLIQTLSVSQGASGSTGSCIVNKVRLLFRADCCYDRLVGAKLQGSTNNSTWTDIYTFSVNGTGSWQEFTFSNSTAYQYVRFQASANGYGELFELEFYNGSTKLTGTVIGAGQALDGDVGTFWHGGAIGTVNYAGLQLSNTCTVTPPTLSLSQSSWAPSASSNSTTVSVISNVSWTATSSATGWLTVSPASGSNNGTLTLTATANTGSARTGTITVAGGGLTQTVTVNQGAGTNCGDTPQNYCLTGTIPANNFRFKSSYASTNIAGPKNNLDGGTPPFYGNAGFLQQYLGVSGSIIYPTYQNDINLPVASTGYRVDLWWPNSTSKVLRLYVNGVQKWSQATTCQDYCQYYPDFSSVVSGDRVYFSVQENATLRIAAQNDVYQKQDELKNDVLVVSPNPTDGKVKAEFYLSKAQAVRLSVIDTQGRTIGIYDKDADAGANSIDLDLQQYASGTYLIQLQLNNKQLVTKVIKQ